MLWTLSYMKRDLKVDVVRLNCACGSCVFQAETRPCREAVSGRAIVELRTERLSIFTFALLFTYSRRVLFDGATYIVSIYIQRHA